MAFTGLGQVYNGQPKKALALIGLSFLFVPFGLLLGWCVKLYTVVDGAITAKRIGSNFELKPYNRWRFYLYYAVAVILTTLLYQELFVGHYRITSGAMIPTLQIGDHISVNKMSYGIRSPFWDSYLVHFKGPQRGDVVLFIFPEDRSKDFIKRVIGVAGDAVEIRAKKVFINGKSLEDTRAHFEGDPPERGPLNVRDNYGPKQVPENHIFRMLA